MVKQVVIQLRDFNKDISDVPLPPDLEQTSPEDLVPVYFKNEFEIDDYKITNEIIRQALIGHVAKGGCNCLGKAYSKKLRILNTEYSFVHTYILETFTERRQTCFDFKPSTEHIVLENNEEIPPIWGIQTDYDPVPFVNHSETSVVPNSEIVKFCNRCNGNETRICPSCIGLKKSCTTCNGSHHIKCDVCINGKLKWFQSLKISWNNHQDQFFTRSMIPETKLKRVTGKIVYEETGLRVKPIKYADDESINNASKKLITKHEENYLQKEKLIQQRHQVKVIVTATVHYEYGGRLGKFWLYYDKIEDLKVYCPKYSKNCCVGCMVS